MDCAIEGSGGGVFYRLFKNNKIPYRGTLSFTIDGNPIEIEMPGKKDDRFLMRGAFYCSAEDVRTLIGKSRWSVKSYA